MKFINISIITLICCLWLMPAWAQQVYFCSSVSSDGNPVGHTNQWAVGEGGGVIVIVYDNGMQKIPGGVLLVQIRKKIVTTGRMEMIEGFEIPVNAPGNWASLEHHFDAAGEYRVNFLNSKEVRLGSGKVKIEIDPTMVSSHEGQNRYSKSKVWFCEKVDGSGFPIDKKSVFDFSGSERMVTIFINNKAPMLTDTIMIDVFRFTGIGNSANHIESLDLPVNPSWDHLAFEYSFLEPGEFMMDFFTKKDVWINSANVKLEK